jgi:uncharacterized membrane protein YjjP (DUF1212 family)
MTTSDGDLRELQTFVVQLGAAMNAVSVPVFTVQERLQRVAAAYGATDPRISAFPTSLLVSMGRGESATLELTTPLASTPRLDQISAVDRLVSEAEQARLSPSDGLRRLDEIRTLAPRYRWLVALLGYSVLTIGICLILSPAAKDVLVAAILGVFVGVLRLIARNESTLQILMPVLAAFSVSALTALAAQADLADPGLRAMIAALVVFLPGAALTTAVTELAGGEMIAGSSRLVWATVQLLLLAFGILAGVEAVGISASEVFSGSAPLLGEWAPWLGVLVYAVGVSIAHSAPKGSFAGLLVVLYAAWIGQFVGNQLFGGFVSGLVGALVMTPVAYILARTRFGMPAFAMFLPGFWLLVPGALSLIGLTELAGDTSTATGDSIAAATASIVAVALGVLCGTLIYQWLTVGARRVAAARPSRSSLHP